MTSPVREMAGALDDAALETLASKGLVRRAAADVAAGRAEIVEETADAVRVTLDGESARVVAAGPRQGACSCPAPGVCRHRLAALMLLRSPAPELAVDWSAEIAAFTVDDLTRFAGRAAWREALAAIDGAALAEVTPEGGALRVRLAADDEPVLLLATGGLDAALTKAPDKVRKLKVATAVLAARRALGLPDLAAAPEARPVEAATGPDDQTLADIRDVLARAYRLAMAFTPEALEADIRRLAVAGRVEAMPRLAAILRRLAGGFDPLRRRAADADPDALLELMAEACALTVALSATAAGPGRAALMGQAREEYQPIGDLALCGLGAELWTTPAGARGVTAWVHDPGRRETFSLTQARADAADGAFDPRAAFHHAPVWGAPMARLCAARVRLGGAVASASGRLSTARSDAVEVLDWTPSADAVSGWDCVHDDWPMLESRLQSRLSGRLTVPAPVRIPVVLAFARHAPVRFDEFTQTLTWPLADRGGRWVGLSLPFEGGSRERIAALERLTARERFWAVLATAELADGGIEIRPYGLWGAGQRLLDFDAPPNPDAKPGEDFAGLLARLTRGFGGGRGGPAGA